MKLIKVVGRLVAAGLALSMAVAAQADTYPSKPIRIIVGFAAGGTADAIARYYAQKMGEVLKTSVIVDNKAGAGQILAVKSMQAAPADGYTLMMGTGSAFSQGPGVRTDLPFDPLKDFTLIGLMAAAPGVIVVPPQLPVRTMGEFIAYAKANPGTLNYASSGVGSASQLQSAYLASLAGMQMTHVPYKADAEIMRSLADGSAHMGIAPIQGAMASITGGRVRALAVTSSKRAASLPDVPSLTELDVKGLQGIDPYSYYGLIGQLGLPPAVVTTLNDAINQVAKSPEAIAHMQKQMSVEPASGTPQFFRQYIQTDLKKWKDFAKHVKLD